MRNLFSILILVIIFTCGCDLTNPFSRLRDNPYETDPYPEVVFSKYAIYSDTNMNGAVNAGDTVKIKVYLKNVGYADVGTLYSVWQYVTSILSTSSSFVQITSYGGYPTARYEDVSIYDETGLDTLGQAYNGADIISENYSYEFKVSSTTSIGQVLDFNLTITDLNDLEWTDSFNITVQ